MNRKQKDVQAAIRTALEDAGAKILSFEQSRGGHQCVRFSVKGEQAKMVFASTPSCHRSVLNSVSRARRKVRHLSDKAFIDAPKQSRNK